MAHDLSLSEQSGTINNQKWLWLWLWLFVSAHLSNICDYKKKGAGVNLQSLHLSEEEEEEEEEGWAQVCVPLCSPGPSYIASADEEWRIYPQELLIPHSKSGSYIEALYWLCVRFRPLHLLWYDSFPLRTLRFYLNPLQLWNFHVSPLLWNF